MVLKSTLREMVHLYREDGLRYLIARIIHRIFRFPVYIGSKVLTKVIGRDEKIWIFSDFPSGQPFSQNRKYLFLYLADNYSGNVRPIWLTKDDELYTKLSQRGYEVYKSTSIGARYYCLRAKYAPIDSSPGAIPWAYTGGATVIQMGHGIPLKTNLSSGSSWLERIVSWKSIDYAVFSSETEREHFQQYVESGHGSERGWINNRLKASHTIYTGYPKSDAIINSIEQKTDSSMLKSGPLFGERSDTTIGYFPTRREGHGLNLGEIIDIPKAEELLSQEGARLLIKPHRQLKLTQDIIQSELIMPVEPNIDSHEFLAKVDILITDYSSIFFDFLFLDRPVIFFVPDYNTYQSIRGIHPNYGNVIAGPQVKTSDELLDHIENVVSGTDKAEERRREIQNQFFNYTDGNSSKRIIEEIEK